MHTISPLIAPDHSTNHRPFHQLFVTPRADANAQLGSIIIVSYYGVIITNCSIDEVLVVDRTREPNTRPIDEIPCKTVAELNYSLSVRRCVILWRAKWQVRLEDWTRLGCRAIFFRGTAG
jgi:hypothetical protein